MYWNDEGWEVSRNPVFSSPKKTPAFLLIPSFLCHFKMSRMTRNENNNGEISFQCHSTHFDFISSFKNDDGMTKWGEMKGCFWTKAKPLILKLTSFHSHSVILMSFQFEVNFKFIPRRRYIACVQKTLIGCCLLRGDSTRLNFSKVISLSFTLIWDWSLSSCLKCNGMTVEWPLNDLIGCCLLRGDSNRLKFSKVISLSFTVI